MKKTVLFIALLSFVLVSHSQENSVLSNKKGKPFLPVAGDISFGVSANPIFSYVGNMLSNSGTNQLNLSLPGNAMYGKYFLTASSAVRIKLGVYRASNSTMNDVDDDENPDQMVTDQMDHVISDYTFSIGYEKRRGAGRLQLFYGGELNISTSKDKTTYSYGNLHSLTNRAPTTTANFSTGQNYQMSSRQLEETQSDGFGIGIRGFAGLEYFVLPKISIGGEFGLGYTKYFGEKNVSSLEVWDYAIDELETNTTEILSDYSYAISDISNGRILILFYF